MTTVLIDADILAYQVSLQAEVETEFPNDLWVLYADAKEARYNLDEAVDAITAKVDADDYVMCLTHPSNYRKDVLPSYKSNRTGRKPMLLPAMRQYIQESHTFLMWDNLEGDDIMGILSTNPETRDNYVVYSADKDMQTLPCWLWDEDDGQARLISEEDANYYFFLQTLTGDTTDGYKGCPSVGPVKAQKILDNDCSWEAVVNTYVKAGLTEKDALQQARCARILRHCDFNHETKEPILWRP